MKQFKKLVICLLGISFLAACGKDGGGSRVAVQNVNGSYVGSNGQPINQNIQQTIDALANQYQSQVMYYGNIDSIARDMLWPNNATPSFNLGQVMGISVAMSLGLGQGVQNLSTELIAQNRHLAHLLITIHDTISMQGGALPVYIAMPLGSLSTYSVNGSNVELVFNDSKGAIVIRGQYTPYSGLSGTLGYQNAGKAYQTVGNVNIMQF